MSKFDRRGKEEESSSIRSGRPNTRLFPGSNGRLGAVPSYKIYRMKESPREHFRWAPHTGGMATLKFKDYEPDADVEAPTPYALWQRLRGQDEVVQALEPGDVLETIGADGSSSLLVVKYIGFEPATWFVPAPRSELEMETNSNDAMEAQHMDSATA